MEIDRETITAVAAPAVVGGLGWLVNKLWRGLGHRIANVEQSAKAARVAVEEVEARRREDAISIRKDFSEHLQRDVEMHEQVLQAMTRQTEKLGDIHVSLAQALGERPTRDEVTRLLELHLAPR